MKCRILASVITGGLIFGSAAQAEQGGTGHYASGAMASFIDALPDQPGWVAESLCLNYNGTYGTLRGLPYGSSIALDVSVSASGESPLLMYSPPFQVLGGHPAFAVAIPYVWVDVKAKGTIDVDGMVHFNR